VNYSKTVQYSTEALITINWDKVELTVEYHAPETGIFIVKVTGSSPLTSDWYKKNKKNLVDDYFDMNWTHDVFAGPTSEYYLSSDDGDNGQFWVERDPSGNVTWLRFSYAL